MENENNQELPHLKALENVLTALDIEFVSLFWDENIYGRKPRNYAEYNVTNEDDSLSSNDSEEEEVYSFVVRFYMKDRNFRSFKRSAIRAFLAAGFFVSTGYETYESDTGYHHFDLNLNYYGG